ncbi:putative glycosyltransferase - possibly involved in cell wall localization and side chain formation of rhamnose-glucose polysaccharide [hydrothermal vent metagenome]|uniref:Putative glycosyltransferase - possibly involved in cell wall localization and side chain formation of rhamnose-glucose polysaccharide n=1 Tax=hydrothermal vent metagenome TaxID=652676 RepID=A0A3B0WCX1_9ZZZZ
MNILELCLSAGLGGLELYVFRSNKALANNSNKNNVIPVLRPDSKLDQYYKNHSSFDIQHIKPFFRALPLLNAKKLAHIIDKNKIDVIHMHWGKDLPLAVFSKLFSKQKPALVYTRQMMITRKKDDFYHNFLYRQLDLLLTITKELEGLCKKFIPLIADRITTLYYGVKSPKKFLDKETLINKRKKLGFTENDFVAGLIGRLEQSKGQHLLIEAIHTAKNDGLNIKALIVGHEMTLGYRGKLKAQAEKLGVLNNIIFQDFSSEPQQLMQICDCVILASAQETFGLVLPEAMRAGVAVIGSNSGGVPEIIEHDKTGLLFKPHDTTHLYMMLHQLYDNPNLLSRLAENGKEKADSTFNDELHYVTLEALLAKKVP